MLGGNPVVKNKISQQKLSQQIKSHGELNSKTDCEN